MMKTQASILIVEDETDLLDSLSFTLKMVGYAVVTAGDGVEALAVLQSHAVNLILSDIVMPRMNGYELYRRVRAEQQWVTIPFIFISVRNLDSDLRYGKELGVDDYLVKPIQTADLLAVVHGNLRRAQQLVQQYNGLYSANQSNFQLVCEDDSINLGPLHIAPSQYRAWFDNELVELPPKEFRLLVHLAQQVGQVIPTSELIRSTHERTLNSKKAGALLRPLISSLRRKLGCVTNEAVYIENVRGTGYRLAIPGH